MNERGFALVEQHSIHTAIKRILRCHRYRCQVEATERIIPNAGDAAGNGDAGQAGAVEERPIPDADDGQAANGGWNGHSPARPCVAGDGASAVAIVGVIELGLHLCRQSQCEGDDSE